MKYKYKNSTGTKKKAIGGLVNKGVSSIAGAISNDSDFNKGAQILGSVAGTTADILTGNIPGAISNGADLVRDGVNAFGEDVDMNTLKTVNQVADMSAMASAFANGGDITKGGDLTPEQLNALRYVADKNNMNPNGLTPDKLKGSSYYEAYKEQLRKEISGTIAPPNARMDSAVVGTTAQYSNGGNTSNPPHKVVGHGKYAKSVNTGYVGNGPSENEYMASKSAYVMPDNVTANPTDSIYLFPSHIAPDNTMVPVSSSRGVLDNVPATLGSLKGFEKSGLHSVDIRDKFGPRLQPYDETGGAVDSYSGSMGNRQYANGGQLTTYDNGGTHEQNPNGGIAVGNNATVEQGETKSGDFVYSDRLKINKRLAKEFSLPKGAVGKTFAEASKMYNDPERLDDQIYQSTRKVELDNLAKAQEAYKAVEMPEQAPTQQMANGGIPGVPNFSMNAINQALLQMPMADDTFNQDYFVNSDPTNMTVGQPNNNLQSLNMADLTPTSTPQVTYPAGTTPTSTSTSTAASGSGVNIPQGAESALRYAPIVGDAVSTGMILNNKPEEKGIGMFDTGVNFEANLVDRNALIEAINAQSGNTRSALTNVSGGNAANLAANLQGADLNSKRAISQAMLSSDIADSQELARVQQMNFRQDANNSGMRMQVANMNDADRAAYISGLIDQVNNTGQNIGNVGSDALNRNLANNLPIGYKVDRFGNVVYDPN
jgi:hypothetical protein